MGRISVLVAGLAVACMWSLPVRAQALEKAPPPCSPQRVSAAEAGAQRSDPAATYLLARYYSTGKCGLADGAKAIALYHKAAALNYPPAFYNLGILAAAHGDFPTAEKMFLKGTTLGHRGCELMLGTLYAMSPPGFRDDTKAYAWLSFTASRGEAVSADASDRLHAMSGWMKPDRAKAKPLIQKLKSRYGAIVAFPEK